MKDYGLKVHSIGKDEIEIWEKEVEKMAPELRGNIIPSDVYDTVIELTQ